MAREFLKGVKSENRLSKVRLIMPNDPVIGGQPYDNTDEFTSNTPFLDLACSIQYAVTQAANANTAASNADKKAGTAQTTANQAKTAAATADGKAVAAQKTADEAKTAAATADGKAVAAQTTANQAKTAAATADSKAVAAQTSANGAKTAADNAQKKANQVPNPLLDQLPIGASGTAYKLITIADLKAKLGVPAKTNVVQTTGSSTTAVMSQKAVTDAVNAVKTTSINQKNGYKKDPNTKIIEQWGNVNRTGAMTKVIFPIPFPAECFIVTLTIKKVTTTSSMNITAQNVTKEGFEIQSGSVESEFYYTCIGI